MDPDAHDKLQVTMADFRSALEHDVRPVSNCFHSNILYIMYQPQVTMADFRSNLEHYGGPGP